MIAHFPGGAFIYDMSKKHKLKAPSPFVMIRIDMLRSKEWRSLSNSAKIVYIYLRAKFNYKTFSEVTLTYSEMNDLMSSATMSKALKDLIKFEWIEVAQHGGLIKGATTYKFKGQFKDFYGKTGLNKAIYPLA